MKLNSNVMFVVSACVVISFAVGLCAYKYSLDQQEQDFLKPIPPISSTNAYNVIEKGFPCNCGGTLEGIRYNGLLVRTFNTDKTMHKVTIDFKLRCKKCNAECIYRHNCPKIVRVRNDIAP